jgi:hypothetical protein
MAFHIRPQTRVNAAAHLAAIGDLAIVVLLTAAILVVAMHCGALGAPFAWGQVP